MKQRNNNIKAVVAIGFLAAACAAGSLFAYLTDTDKVENKFTSGYVSGALTEASFTEDITEMYPAQVIPKDPVITNDGTEDALAFMEFTIPVSFVATENDAGAASEKHNVEMFTFCDESGLPGTNSGWVQIGDKTPVYEGSDLAEYKYVFGYDTVLSADDYTTPVFSSVQYANVTGLTENVEYTIPVTADLIQADGLGFEPSGTISKTNLTTAYSKFLGDDQN